MAQFGTSLLPCYNYGAHYAVIDFEVFSMFELVILLAQNTTRYNRGLSIFQLGLTGAGIAIIILGAGLFFAKTKDPQKQTSTAVRWISLGACSLIGLAIIAYAWLAFSTL